MNDGHEYCAHGWKADTLIHPLPYQPWWGQRIASRCPRCKGKPIGAPFIDHGSPKRAAREPADKEKVSAALHHGTALAA